ncbi:beta-phosphoglucomutase family hydrolase [Dermatophilaceae bacterium Soc4.6]
MSRSAITTTGLRAGTSACLFDLDGVLTDTATVHAHAWKEMFDRFLTARAQEAHTPYDAFDQVTDYDTYVDGRSRADGTRAFLASRGIALPEGDPGDEPGAPTVAGLAAAKNAIVLRRIRHDGVEPYPGSLRYLKAVRSAGLLTAVVSSSANCAEVLEAAGLTDLFEVRVDGLTAEDQHLAGKPAPDTYLAAAKLLHVEPGESAIFEDALSGVAAGRAGGFGLVVGVDRVGQAAELREHGADVVVDDLADLLGGVDEA